MRNFARKLNFKCKIKLLYQITCYKMLEANILITCHDIFVNYIRQKVYLIVESTSYF
jgi:hypothetical protein